MGQNGALARLRCGYVRRRDRSVQIRIPSTMTTDRKDTHALQNARRLLVVTKTIEADLAKHGPSLPQPEADRLTAYVESVLRVECELADVVRMLLTPDGIGRT